MDFLERYAVLFKKYPKIPGYWYTYPFSSDFPDELEPLMDQATDEIIFNDLSMNKTVALVYLASFPRHYWLFSATVRSDLDVARVVITESGGTVFSEMPVVVRQNEELALLAFQLNPTGGYSIPFQVRRKIITLAVARRAAQIPHDVDSLKIMRYIPAPVRRQYAREKVGERRSFAVFLKSKGANKVPGIFNQIIGEYLGLAVGRKPRAYGKKIYWPLYLEREAGLKRKRA
jgi:hypothetical protein